MYQWMKGSAYQELATFMSTNITLNSPAARHFESIRWVMVGIDYDSKQVAIKPVHKQQIDLGLVDKSQLHKLSIGNGYARISNKQMMGEIQNMLRVSDINGIKYGCTYDESEDLLIIHTDSNN